MDRRLAAILVADVVGYSAMMEQDEPGTLTRLFALEEQVIEPAVVEHHGRIVKTVGDGYLAEFDSAVNAVGCALAVQRGVGAFVDVGDPLTLRIGVHVGDVAVRADDVYGDAVNVAARLEQSAPPGGVLISSTVYEHLAGNHTDKFREHGVLDLKNIERDISAWVWDGRGGLVAQPLHRIVSMATIAVLPFDDLSEARSQSYFADGIVEDLITALARFHWFRVTARNSSFAVRSESAPVRDLGARYLVEGSVRRSGDRVRVTTRLLDSDTGSMVWSERFDRIERDLFELQDDIVEAIVGALVPEFVASFRRGKDAPGRGSVDAWESAMKGWSLVSRAGVTRDEWDDAEALFEGVLERDHGNTLALAGSAFAHLNPYFLHGIERDLPSARRLAEKALRIDAKDALAWVILAMADLHADRFDVAEDHARRAVSINPSLSIAYSCLTAIAGYRCDPDSADAWFNRMRTVSPLDPMLEATAAYRAFARFGVGAYAEALSLIDDVLRDVPKLPSAIRIKAATLVMLGDVDAARRTIATLPASGEITMAWVTENLRPMTDTEAWERYTGSLREAGVPD